MHIEMKLKFFMVVQFIEIKITNKSAINDNAGSETILHYIEAKTVSSETDFDYYNASDF